VKKIKLYLPELPSWLLSLQRQLKGCRTLWMSSINCQRQVRDQANATRKACKEFGSDEDRVNMTHLSPLAGIQRVIIDDHPSYIVDDAHLCGDIREAGVNCSNRSCMMAIYRQDGRGWRKILEEVLMENYPVLDWDVEYSGTSVAPVFQMLVATIWAGDPRCHPKRPSTDYSSGRSCNIIGRYHNNAWQWEKVR
jgi:hypothetical protein